MLAVRRGPQQANRTPDAHLFRVHVPHTGLEMGGVRVVRLCIRIASGSWLMAMFTGRPQASSIPVEAPPPPAKLSTMISSSMLICPLFTTPAPPPASGGKVATLIVIGEKQP